MSSSSARFVGTIRGAMPAGVVPAVPPAPGTEAPLLKPKLKDELYIGLVDLLRSKDSETREKIRTLIGQRVVMNQEIEQLLAAAARRDNSETVERHEEVKSRCRELHKSIADTKGEMMELASARAGAQNKHEMAMTALHNAKLDRASLGRYASDAELQKADSICLKAEQAVAKCAEVVAVTTMKYNDLAVVKMRELSEALRVAEAEERDLGLLRYGHAGVDSFGFQHAERT